MKSYKEISLKYLKHNKKRTAVFALCIVFSMFLITSVAVIINSYIELGMETVFYQSGKYSGAIRNVREGVLEKIAEYPAFSKIGSTMDVGISSFQDYSVSIIGSDMVAVEMLSVKIIKGKYPEKKGELAIEEWVYNKLSDKPELGGKFKLTFKNSAIINGHEELTDGEAEFTLCGILKNSYRSELSKMGKAYVSIETAKEITPFFAQKYLQYFQFKKGQNSEYDINELEKFLITPPKGDLNINSSYEGLERIASNAKLLTAILDIVVALAVITIIFNMFNISISERVRQLGLLKSIGITPKQIKIIIFREALLLAVIFVPVGIVVGVLGTQALLYVIEKITNIELNAKTSIFSVVFPAILGFSSIMLAAYKPAKQAAKITLIESLNSDSKVLDNKKNISNRLQQQVKGNRIFGYTGKMAATNIKRNKKRFMTTVAAMSISIALLVTVNYFIGVADPFELADKVVGADYTLTINGFHDNLGYSQQIVDDLALLQGIKSIIEYKNDYVRLIFNEKYLTEEGKKKYKDYITKVNGLDGSTYNISARFYGCSDSVMDNILKENKVSDFQYQDKIPILIIQNTNYVENTDFKVGDDITTCFMLRAKPEWIKINQTCNIKGIIKDPPFMINKVEGIPIVITYSKYIEDAVKLMGYQRIDIFLEKDADRQIIEKKIKDIVSNQKYGKYESYDGYVENVKNIRLQIGTILYLLVSIIVFVGVINIINTMVMNIVLRKREFAMLKAIGMSNSQIRAMILKEGFVYGFVSGIIGNTVGIGFVGILYNSVKSIMDMKFELSTIMIASTFVVTILLCMLSALVSLKKATSIEIVEGLRAIE